MPSWLPVALTIADFVVQRIDRVGPVSFEPPEKQPPERARSVAPSAEKPKASGAAEGTPPESGSKAANDSPAVGFQPRGRTATEREEEPGFVAQSGGGSDPSSGGDPGSDNGSDNGSDGENEGRCSFRSMPIRDSPATYEV